MDALGVRRDAGPPWKGKEKNKQWRPDVPTGGFANLIL